MRRLQFILIGFLLVAALGYLLITRIWAVQVTPVSPIPGQYVSPFSRIGISFNQPMQVESVEAAFQVQPPLHGTWQWDGNTAWFHPAQALSAGSEYSIRLQAGALSLNGRRTMSSLTWKFRVRYPEVLFASPVYGSRNLWSISLDGSTIRQLTSTGGILDYAVSPDGNQIAYTAQKSAGGADLWLIGREGGQPKRMVDCGMSTCLQPAWNPDGVRIAYIKASQVTSAAYPPGEIWLLDIRTGETGQLERAQPVIGSRPSWSPDGTGLAFFVPQQNEIRILNLRNEPEVRLETTQEGALTWLPASAEVAFLTAQTNGVSPYSEVGVYDFKSKQVKVLLGSGVADLDYALPAWSPDEAWMVTSQRIPGGNPARQLWLLQGDGTPVKAITADPTHNASAYRWDPWGSAIVFLQAPMGVADAQPQVMIWERDTGEIHKLADGTQPEWLP